MQSAVSTQATNQMSTAVGPQSLSSAAPQTMPQGPTPQMSSPTKDVNTASLCSAGQQAVQDLVQKTQEMFKLLKDLQLPNGPNVSAQLHQEKRNKVEETLKFMGPYFRKLRIVYNKVLEDTAHLEGQCIENILPVEEEDGRVGGLQQQMNDAVPYASQERQELIEQIQAKNRHLKEIIDKLRLVIWEINTMLDMRKV